MFAPRPTPRSWEHECGVVGTATRKTPLIEVLGQVTEHRHSPMFLGLRVLRLTERDRLVDPDRALGDITPSQRERLTRPQPAVGKHGDERLVRQSGNRRAYPL